MPDAQYVDQPQALTELCTRLGSAGWLALDTEFMREKTYYPRLCLIQIASIDAVAVIDPLALPDLKPVFELLANPACVKVLHAAGQDLEVLYQAGAPALAPLFDTQLAAALLGHGEQIGYAALVKALLGKELHKAHTRADWSRRPLDADELTYAADDVRYLGPLYAQLNDELQSTGRKDWLRQETAALADPVNYQPDPQDQWQRLRGLHRLAPGAQHIAARLAAWRETTAMRLNRPRKWILADEVLTDIAQRAPRNLEELQRLRDMPERTLAQHADAWLECVRQGLSEAATPVVAPPQRLSPEQAPLADLLMSALRQLASAQRISPALLATRDEIDRLVLGQRDLALLQGWRGELAGQTLLAALEGQVGFRIANGELRLETLVKSS
ncbi:MAG: ribonuclease D [Nevskiales bacterium]